MPENFCTHCGTPVISDANFCAACGKPLRKPQGTEKAVEQPAKMKHLEYSQIKAKWTSDSFYWYCTLVAIAQGNGSAEYIAASSRRFKVLKGGILPLLKYLPGDIQFSGGEPSERDIMKAPEYAPALKNLEAQLVRDRWKRDERSRGSIRYYREIENPA